ncbi:uncharacterized protein J7T54_006525 [Emericellopsis cladophorae]|uniref:Uncharacterized protein n=1 Tax=Emericellopsis cladophorae TaxID=2686198 RepID=A0A9P9Y6Z7_9HYPO|nr:uncharacterized protein J7T54_006525 [Emericellopsis cladophorae]KAI6784480.1 hypothetical protein J7T54_006525 [Emericellopsis cladophorae]
MNSPPDDTDSLRDFNRRSPSPSRSLSDLSSDGHFDDERCLRPAPHHHLSVSEIESTGGFSPPAWRRNHDSAARSNNENRTGPDEHRPPMMLDLSNGFEVQDHAEHSDRVLAHAAAVRLPRASHSPAMTRQSSPEISRSDPREVPPLAETDNETYMRFAWRAEVTQRTGPIDTLVNMVRTPYRAATRTRVSTMTSILVAILSITFLKIVLSPVKSRPAGDLVKIAGIARSFEPLIYYSEHANVQAQGLLSTSMAVVDLSESLRRSTMDYAPRLVVTLDSLSEDLRMLAVEVTRFLTTVDSDMDGILSVMDWSKMHLSRFQSNKHQGLLSSAYDNVYDALSSAHILEDDAGHQTSAGAVTTYIFGFPEAKREQRLIQHMFDEFITVLDESITSELEQSLSLFQLYDAVDKNMANVGRTVAQESSAQDHLHNDALSGLWARILGPNAADISKYEKNHRLLTNVRASTNQNRALLEHHKTQLLSLQQSLNRLRGHLVSPRMRGANQTVLTLQDQIQGIDDVNRYLTDIRLKQKSRVMENLYARMPSQATHMGWDVHERRDELTN